MSGAITATVAAVAAMTTAEVFTAVAIVGAVVGGVGAVTGIKPLQYAGMALGAIGGIGALAVSAGVLGADALGTVAGGIDAVGNPIASAASGFVGDAATGESFAAAVSPQEQGMIDAGLQFGQQSPGISTSFTPDIVNSMTGEVTVPYANTTSPGTSAQEIEDAFNNPSSVVNAQSPDVTPAAATDKGLNAPPDLSGKAAANDPTLSTPPGGVAAPSAPASGAPPAPATPAATAVSGDIPPAGPGLAPGATAPYAPTTGTNAVANPLDAGLPGSYAAAQRAAMTGGPILYNPAGTPSTFAQIMDLLGKPGVGTLAAGAIQAGASFIAGATSSLTPAQVEALKAQAQANQAAANMSTLQQSNIKSGVPIASIPPRGIVNTPVPA